MTQTSLKRILILAAVLTALCLAVGGALGQIIYAPFDFCSEGEKKRSASECFVKVAVGRIQDQVDEYTKATFDVARMERDIEELKRQVGENTREINELNTALKALGRE